MYLDCVHSLSLCTWPPLMYPVSPKQNGREKKRKKINEKNFKKGEGIKNLIMEAALWSNKSHCEPLCPYISTCKCSLQRVICLVWGPWSPLHIRCRASTRTLPGRPDATLCYGDPAALFLWVRFLYVFQQIIDGVDVGAGQVITLVLGLGSCRVGPTDGWWGSSSIVTISGLDHLHLH